MLNVTIRLMPSGRVLGSMNIRNVAGSKLADYAVRLSAEGEGYREGKVHQYARFSASIWDLVARAAIKTLTGDESFPERPDELSVPYHYTDKDLAYVRLSEIPQPARTVFRRRMSASTRPDIEDGQETYWAWDWEAFTQGNR